MRWMMERKSDQSDALQALINLKPSHKVAALLFVAGKLASLSAGAMIFVNRTLGFWNIMLAGGLIFLCVLVCVVEMFHAGQGVDRKIERLEKELENLKRQRG